MFSLPSPKRGFSLIEILLVLVILSVIVGITVPNFSNTYSNIQLKKCTQDLAHLMRYAQSRAVTKGAEVRLVFDPDNQAFWIEDKKKDNEAEEFAQFHRIRSRMGRAQNFPMDSDIEFENDRTVFFPDASIEKNQFRICQDENCFIVTTKLQRGHVHVYKESKDG